MNPLDSPPHPAPRRAAPSHRGSVAPAGQGPCRPVPIFTNSCADGCCPRRRQRGPRRSLRSRRFIGGAFGGCDEALVARPASRSRGADGPRQRRARRLRADTPATRTSRGWLALGFAAQPERLHVDGSVGGVLELSRSPAHSRSRLPAVARRRRQGPGRAQVAWFPALMAEFPVSQIEIRCVRDC